MSCCVPHCLSNKRCDKDFSYHTFPSNPIVRKNWEKAIFGDAFSMSLRSAIVCSRHFISSDFRMNKMRKILRRNAVPTVNIPFRKQLRHIQKNLKLLKENIEMKPESAEIETDDFAHPTKNYYSNAVSYSLKIIHLKNTMKAFIKQLKRLEDSVLTLNKELDYYAENIKFQNMKRIFELHESGQVDTRTSFLLNQIKNFAKAKPHWPERILHESAILHSECPSSYKALIKRNILQLPSEMTLRRYIKHITTRTSMADKTQQKPKEETYVIKNERIFYTIVSEHIRSDEQFNNNLEMISQADINNYIGIVESYYTEELILHKKISNELNLIEAEKTRGVLPSAEKLCELNINTVNPISEGSNVLGEISMNIMLV